VRWDNPLHSGQPIKSDQAEGERRVKVSSARMEDIEKRASCRKQSVEGRKGTEEGRSGNELAPKEKLNLGGEAQG
jgi:hypothetical protein